MGAGSEHSSIRALLEASGFPDPVLAIRDHAATLVAEARAAGWTGPPYDPELLASVRGIHVNPCTEDSFANEALIHTRDDGALEILYRSGSVETRRRFSICHEISHTFFPDCFEIVRFRARAPRQFDPDRQVENLCDIGAGHLLLPDPDFSEDVMELRVTVESIDSLRDRYRASREAVAIRMVQLDLEPCAAVFLTDRLKPSEERVLAAGRNPAPKSRLRVDFMVTSSSFPGARIPKHKSIPEDSCAHELLLGQSTYDFSTVVSANEAWDGGHAKLPMCIVEAMGIPPNAAGEQRVLALLFPAGKR